MKTITITETERGILVGGLTLFSLEDTLNCGQCFRFRRDADGWRGVAENHPLFLQEQPEGLLLSCSREEFENFWRGYFDLDRDYAALRDQYLAIPALRECACYAPGIRVLRQDAWEALISFLKTTTSNGFRGSSPGFVHSSALPAERTRWNRTALRTRFLSPPLWRSGRRRNSRPCGRDGGPLMCWTRRGKCLPAGST